MEKTIYKALDIIREYDESLYNHCINTAFLSKKLIQMCEIHFNNSSITNIINAAFIHDLGKISIPKSLLDKKEPLSSSEKAEIDKHSYYGYLLAQNLNLNSEISLMIGLHHGFNLDNQDLYILLNKFNPTLLKAVEVIQIADAYDALTSNRAYRNAFEHEDAMHIIKNDKSFSLFAKTLLNDYFKNDYKKFMEVNASCIKM